MNCIFISYKIQLYDFDTQKRIKDFRQVYQTFENS